MINRTSLGNRLSEKPYLLTPAQAEIVLRLAYSERAILPWSEASTAQQAVRTMRALAIKGWIVGAENIQVGLTRKGREKVAEASGSTEWPWLNLPAVENLPRSVLARALPAAKP